MNIVIISRNDLPWDEQPQDAQRAKLFQWSALAIGVACAVIIPFLHLEAPKPPPPPPSCGDGYHLDNVLGLALTQESETALAGTLTSFVAAEYHVTGKGANGAVVQSTISAGDLQTLGLTAGSDVFLKTEWVIANDGVVTGFKSISTQGATTTVTLYHDKLEYTISLATAEAQRLKLQDLKDHNKGVFIKEITHVVPKSDGAFAAKIESTPSLYQATVQGKDGKTYPVVISSDEQRALGLKMGSSAVPVFLPTKQECRPDAVVPVTPEAPPLPPPPPPPKPEVVKPEPKPDLTAKPEPKPEPEKSKPTISPEEKAANDKAIADAKAAAQKEASQKAAKAAADKAIGKAIGGLPDFAANTPSNAPAQKNTGSVAKAAEAAIAGVTSPNGKVTSHATTAGATASSGSIQGGRQVADAKVGGKYGGSNVGVIDGTTGTSTEVAATNRPNRPKETNIGTNSGGSEAGARTNESVRKGFDTKASALATAYNKALLADDSLSGSIRVKLSISKDGRVTGCDILTDVNDDFKQTLLNIIKKIDFGPASGDWSGNYTLNLIRS